MLSASYSFTGPKSKPSASPSTWTVPPGPISGPTWTSPQQETAKQTALPTSPEDLSEEQ